MSNFILICSLQLILMVVGGGSVANLWKQMIAASAGKNVIVAGYAQQCGSLLV
jgi:sugar (pentulose or hexulose) kinase